MAFDKKKRMMISVSLAILLINIITIFYTAGYFSGKITGFSVNSLIDNGFVKISLLGKIFLICEWIFLILIVVVSFLNEKKLNSKIIETEDLNISRKTGENTTDLDILYENLKEKKSLSLQTISKSFNICKETALSWCKILETSDLAYIEYSGFKEPVLYIKETETKEENLEKPKNKKSFFSFFQKKKCK